MENYNVLPEHIDKIHTTEMGIGRIKKNLKLDDVDVVEYCKQKILDSRGKNWYCSIDGVTITVNASSYTIITAHKLIRS